MGELLSPYQIKQIETTYKKRDKNGMKSTMQQVRDIKSVASWSELYLLSVARKAGLDKLYLQCYYDPALQTHTTDSSLIS